MTSAKTYFYEQLPDELAETEVPDVTIQRELWRRFQSGEEQAALCLRCFISHQIDQVCRNLSSKFGDRNGFTYWDVLPFVLDDDGRSHPTESLWKTILHSFDPDKASLSTWINLKAKQHPELKRFLLEHGVYLVSDWAILNDTKQNSLQQILSESYYLPDVEIQYSSALLYGFHAVYRQDRLRLRRSGARLPCQPPTVEQLKRISIELYSRTQKSVDHETILNQLKAIASKLRRARILARGGSVQTVSLDEPDMQPVIDQVESSPEDDEVLDFLKFYQDQFLSCLDSAIAQVIPTVLENFQRRRRPVEEAFLTALHLFHCQGQSMGEIAPQVGLKKQYEVTRLLKLADLRTDIRQQSLVYLRDRVMDEARFYADVGRLQQLEKQVDSILDEQLSSVIAEAETEALSPIRNQPLRSLFARRLCHYLASRKYSYV